MPPINPLLLKSSAQALGRAAQQVVKAAPGLAEKATGATRLASKTMSGLSGLSERLPSKLPSAATLQQGLAGLRPRLQNASLLGQMGRLGEGVAQMSQLAQMLPTGPTEPAAPTRPSEPAEPTKPTKPTKPTNPTTPTANPGHIPPGPFGAIRDAAHSALKGPMAAAVRGSDRASRVAGEFLQALHDIEGSALYQNFAPPLVNQMLGEAKTGLQAIHDMIQRFQSGLGKLDTALQPAPSGAKPPPLPPRPTTPKPNSSMRTDDGKPSSTSSSATSADFFSAQSTLPSAPTASTTGPTK
jgi:hypothetical protein